MKATFRQSMNRLHTWAGVVLGLLLFAIFWMGTLSVFDREIDRWMAPMTRLPMSEVSAPLDETLRTVIRAANDAKASTLSVLLPNERVPVFRISYRDSSVTVVLYINPATGAVLPDPGTLAGTNFIYPFHYNLHVRIGNIGVWLVGLAGMTMLLLCISGIVIHRKIFADFFTFRLERRPRRAILDLHNLAGVLGFPFHIVITLSGLMIFYAIYFPAGWQAIYKDSRAFSADLFESYFRPESGIIADDISLDVAISAARRLWNGDKIQSLSIHHLGDAAAYFRINRSTEKDVMLQGDAAFFDAATAALLYQRHSARPVIAVQGFIAGIHFIQFKRWSLRWLYFLLGLLGCVLIATGYLFWLESRRKKHAQLGLSGVSLVDGMTIGGTTGIVIATLAFFVANRLLPLETTFLGVKRAALEVWIFYLVWIATFGHAWLRPHDAWRMQCYAIAAFAAVAVALNWITTADHLIRSITHPHLWAIAGMDLTLLAGAMIAILAAQVLRRRAPGPDALAAAAGTMR